MTAVERLLQVARDEIGYLEKRTNSQLDSDTANAGYNNYTKYARDLDKLGVYNGSKNGFSWCDVFVDWCFIESFGLDIGVQMICQPMNGLGAGCYYSAGYYQSAGRYHKNDPKVGDQIFFYDKTGSIGHTGIVSAIKDGRVYVIEGNTSASSGVVANGGGVVEKNYSLSYNKIAGYGRPDFDLAGDEWEEDMDVNRFKELMIEYRKELQDNDASNWSKEARDWAVENGLIAGNGTEINGEPNYMWGDLLTREQMAALLYRFAKLMGKA